MYYSAINMVWGEWACDPSPAAGEKLRVGCQSTHMQGHGATNSTGNTSVETAVHTVTDNAMELQSQHRSRHKQE